MNRVFALAALLLLSAVGHAADEYVVHTFKKITLTDKFYCEGAYAGDFNKDGKMDVVSGPYWYEGPDFQKKHEIYAPVAFDPKGYSKNFVCYVGDFNADGWTDVLVLGFPGETSRWYENPKGAEGLWKEHIAIKVTDNESPQFTDVTGDGKPEVVFHTGGVLGYAAPDPADPTKLWPFHPISTPGKRERFTHGIGVGDVNGDKKIDFIESGGWWEQPASLEGDALFKFHPFQFCGGGAQMYAYDVDGDGIPDVVTSLAAHGYGLAWFKQNKEGAFEKRVIMGTKVADNKYGVRFSQLHAVDLVDMDGDGLKDIVTGKRYWAHGPGGDADPGDPAVLYWFKLVRGANGEVDFIPYMIDDNSGIGTQVAALDLNGDGLPDVVVGNKKGTFVFIHEVKKVSKEEWEKAQPKVYVAPAAAAPTTPPAPPAAK